MFISLKGPKMKKILLLMLLMPLTVLAKDYDFSQVVFFGDSLSDTGNLYRDTLHLIPKSPPYYHGHFSDGQMWVEKFYSHFFPGRNDVEEYNYAFGGASAFLSVDAPLPYSLEGEISNYLFWYAPDDLSKTLFVVWIGGNNYIKNPHDAEGTSRKAVEAIKKQIERLISHGANKFVVPNLPDMGKMPEATEEHKDGKLHSMTRLHNDRLAAMLEELKSEHSDVIFVDFDAEETLQEVFDDPDRFHMHHVKEACYTGGYTFKPSQSDMKEYVNTHATFSNLKLTQTEREKLLDNPDIAETIKVAMFQEKHPKLSLDCRDYLFWDHIHPTTIAHSYIAQYMIEAVEEAGLNVSH